MLPARILDALDEPFGLALRTFSQPGEIIAWDLFWTPMQTSAGAQPGVALLLATKHPVLGTNPLTAFRPFAWTQANDEVFINQVVQEMVAGLRSMKAEILKGPGQN